MFYTFAEVKTKFPQISNAGLRNLLIDRKIERHPSTKLNGFPNSRKFVYPKELIDRMTYNRPESELERVKRKLFDVEETIYKEGETVSFWEGSFKWSGTIQEVRKDDYIVNGDKIGRVVKKWFELGK